MIIAFRFHRSWPKIQPSRRWWVSLRSQLSKGVALNQVDPNLKESFNIITPFPPRISNTPFPPLTTPKGSNTSKKTLGLNLCFCQSKAYPSHFQPDNGQWPPTRGTNAWSQSSGTSQLNNWRKSVMFISTTWSPEIWRSTPPSFPTKTRGPICVNKYIEIDINTPTHPKFNWHFTPEKLPFSPIGKELDRLPSTIF